MTKIVQIISCPWDADNGKRTYSIVALGEDGRVYRYAAGQASWNQLSDRVQSANGPVSQPNQQRKSQRVKSYVPEPPPTDGDVPW